MKKLIAVDFEQGRFEPLREFLTLAYEVMPIEREKVDALLDGEIPDVVLLFMAGGNEDDFAILRRIREKVPYVPLIVVSDVERADMIVRVVKEGAFDFLVHPVVHEKIALMIERALEQRHLRDEVDYLRREQDIIYDFDKIIAASPPMKKIIQSLKKFAMTDATILMTGETGTGKSFLAGAVHFNSGRRKNPFININCANIPEALLESELFGHEKGAFTGATKTRVGRLEQGNGGTVFLDEIGEMPPPLQAKLLRVLEEKKFERIGGNQTIHSDVRIIAATNRDPEELIEEKKFRKDLYYRLNVLRVHLPPLKERRECIAPLVWHLFARQSRAMKKKIRGISQEAMVRLQDYHWPGNIRQLANAIERAIILEESDILEPDSIDMPQNITVRRIPAREGPKTPETLIDSERDAIVRALEKSLWIQKDAAELLDISPRALNYKIKKLGISHPRWKKNV